VQAKVIAGAFKAGDIEQLGIVQRPDTEPLLFDLQLSAESAVSPQVPDGHRLLLYVYEGTLRVGEQAVSKGQLVQMSQDGELNLSSERGARLMLLAGRPLGEPIVQYGPFVMNSREEIEQALRDFRDGTLA